MIACGKTERDPSPSAEDARNAGGNGGTSVGTAQAGSLGAGAVPANDAGGLNAGAGGLAGHSNQTESAGAAGESAGAAGDNAGGEAGAPSQNPKPEVLLGDYDIALSISKPKDCEPEFTETHLNFQVNRALGRVPKIETVAFADWASGSPADLKISNGWVIVPEQRDENGKLWMPQLEIKVDEQGFVGNGRARIPYKCQSAAALAAAAAKIPSLTIRPDKTPPKIRATPTFPGGKLFAFGSVTFWASEPLMHESTYDRGFQVPDDASSKLEFLDTATNVRVGAVWGTWPWGPAATFSFAEPNKVAGHSIALNVTGKVTDRAGNQAVALPDTHLVQAVPGPFSKIDFDANATSFAHSGAIFHPAGEANSPCESGACVELLGVSEACADVELNGPKTFVAVHVKASEPSHPRVRFRLWSSIESSPWLWVFNERDCGTETDARITLKRLPQPDGSLTHATEWTTFDQLSCMTPRTEFGIVFALPCTPVAKAAHERLVIEFVDTIPVEP